MVNVTAYNLQLKLQAMHACQFTYKHIVANACYISRDMWGRNVSKSRSNLQGTQGHLYWCHMIGHIATMSLSCSISITLSVISQNLKRPHDHEHIHKKEKYNKNSSFTLNK